MHRLEYAQHFQNWSLILHAFFDRISDPKRSSIAFEMFIKLKWLHTVTARAFFKSATSSARSRDGFAPWLDCDKNLMSSMIWFSVRAGNAPIRCNIVVIKIITASDTRVRSIFAVSHHHFRQPTMQQSNTIFTFTNFFLNWTGAIGIFYRLCRSLCSVLFIQK